MLPEPAPRQPAVRAPWPDWLAWEPRYIWISVVTHFPKAKRAVFAIADLVSRKWVHTLVSVEETSTQVMVVFTEGLKLDGLIEELTPERLDLDLDDPRRPGLLAVSDIHTAPR